MARNNGARLLPLGVWGVALLCCLAWNAAAARWDYQQRGTSHLVGIDANFYFAWGRSLAFDGDIDFTNEFRYLAGDERLGDTQAFFARYLENIPPTNTGRPRNKFAMGPGLLSVPALWLTRGLASVYGAMTGMESTTPGGARGNSKKNEGRGFDYENDYERAHEISEAGVPAHSGIYSFAFIATSIVVSFLGLAFCYLLLLRFHAPGTALAAIVAGALGTSLGYYILFEPGMAHAPSAAFTALFLLAAVRWSEALERAGAEASSQTVHRRAFLMGFALGAACLMRFTNIACILVPFVLAISLSQRAERDRRTRILRWSLGCLPAAAAGLALGFLPQALAWRTLFGSAVTYSYAGEPFDAWPRHTLLVLFGSTNSLFLWTPLALVAVFGLARAAQRGAALATAGLGVLLLTALIYGSWPGFTMGDAFGMRGFVDLSPFLLLGLGEAMRFGRERAPRAMPALIGALTAWNLYFLVCYRAEIQPHGEPFVGAALFQEPGRWARQVEKDTGLGFLRGSLEAGGGVSEL